MKRFLMTTALVMTTAAGGAFAQANDPDTMQLRNSVAQSLITSEYDVDVNSLTDVQVTKLYQAFNSTSSESEQDSMIRGVLAEDNVIMIEDRPDFVIVGEEEMPRDQIYTSVSMALVGTPYEGMAWQLTDEELAQAYGIFNSGDEEGSQKDLALSALFE